VAKTRDEEWFNEDQQRWWADQKRDEEELQQMHEERLREELMTEVIMEFKQRFMAKIQQEAEVMARACYYRGFVHGFVAALAGSVLFFVLTQ